jgi:ABC-type glycerol-3-phosphate transport system substrate-binding protein
MKISKTISIILISACVLFSMAACQGPGESGANDSSKAVSATDSNTSVTSEETTDSGSNVASSESTKSAPGNSNAGTSSTKTASTTSGIKIDMKALRGTTVKMLLWRELTAEEVTRINKFKQETGISIVSESVSTSAYTAKLAAKVSASESPDIAIISTDTKTQGAFPLGAASLFQPISVTGQDLTDGKIWDIGSMKQMMLKNQYYAFIANNAWYNCGSIVMYNKDILDECGADDPYALWKAGNWNWDTMKSIALKVYDYGQINGSNYSGIGQQAPKSPDFGRYLMSSTGSDFVSYNGKTFSTNVSDSNVIKAWTFHAELKESKAFNDSADANIFFQKKVALYSTNLWAMKLDGGQIFHCNFTVNCVPFPSPSGAEKIVPGNPNCFGIPKGAKNEVGAGVFIKYFVDPANGVDYATLTGHAASREVYEYLSAPSTKKSIPYSGGALGYTNLANLKKLTSELTAASSSQVTTVLQQYKAFIDNSVDKINKVIG